MMSKQLKYRIPQIIVSLSRQFNNPSNFATGTPYSLGANNLQLWVFNWKGQHHRLDLQKTNCRLEI